MQRVPQLKGIIPALVTPYRGDGTINTESLGSLVERSLEQGVDGFYVCGTTGEAFLLTESERMQVAEAAVTACDGRVPIVVHVGSISTDQSIRLARHAASIDAAAVSAIPPFYYSFGAEEIKRHYLDIIDAAGLPMVLYNFPALSGVTLNLNSARDLLTHEMVIAVKHTSMDLYQLERMKGFRDDLVVLNGHDEVFLPSLTFGADGAIGSTFNIMADQFIAIRDCYLAGRMREARDLQQRANDLIETLIGAGVFNGIKYLLERQGIEVGVCRRPFMGLTDAARGSLDEAWQSLRAG